MDTKIGGSRFTRSGRTREQDPRSVWAPAGPLTDAAERVSLGRTVAITRGFDRNSRQRTKALRMLLDERGIPAIEVTPSTELAVSSGAEGVLDGSEIAAVINVLTAGSWQPYRLAARRRVPILMPKRSEEDTASEVARDVIAMTTDSGSRDIALSRIVVCPEDSGTTSLVVSGGGEPLALPGGWIALTPGEPGMRARIGAPDFAEQEFDSAEVRVETLDGPHRLVRDELPIAEFEGTVDFTAEPAGLAVRTV